MARVGASGACAWPGRDWACPWWGARRPRSWCTHGSRMCSWNWRPVRAPRVSRSSCTKCSGTTRYRRSARCALDRRSHALERRPAGLQLLGTPSPVLLYCLPDRSGSGATPLPALHAAAELMRTPARRYNAYFFRHLIVALRPLAVRLEERYVATSASPAPSDLTLVTEGIVSGHRRLILKLYAWAWPGEEEGAPEQPDEAEFEARRVLDELTSLNATRCYFALIKIIPSQVRTSPNNIILAQIILLCPLNIVQFTHFNQLAW